MREPTSRQSSIEVRLHGTPIADLAHTNAGRASLSWRPEAISRWGMNSTVFSSALPIGTTDSVGVEAFFGGLLPEGRGLTRLATLTQERSDDVAGLIRHIGSDLAGALTLHTAPMPPNDAPHPDTPLTTAEFEEMLRSAAGYLRFAGGGGSANTGVQPKLTLRRSDGGWYLATAEQPSTHILKPAAVEQRRHIEAEAFLLELGRRVGLVTYDSWVEEVADRVVLVIERYDREILPESTDGNVTRVHQEDAAQALSLPWGGDDKYEWSNARSSLKAVAQRLDPGGIFTRPTADRLNLLAYTTFNVAVGNTDAHAKNLSFVSDAQGRWRLAPLYDVTPQALFHEDAGGLAMFVAGRQRLAEIRLSDLVAEGVSWGLPQDAADATVRHTLEQLEGAVAAVPAAASITDHLPGYVRRIAGSLLQGGTAWLGGPTHPMFWPRIE
ncbi:MAG: type II toxin-antitoxin system HipA family toxin [Pseudoclavibacter sp.]